LSVNNYIHIHTYIALNLIEGSPLISLLP